MSDHSAHRVPGDSHDPIDAFAKIRRRFFGKLLVYVIVPQIPIVVLLAVTGAILDPAGYIPKDIPPYFVGVFLLFDLVLLCSCVGVVTHLYRAELSRSNDLLKQLNEEQRQAAAHRISPLIPMLRRLAPIVIHLVAALWAILAFVGLIAYLYAGDERHWPLPFTADCLLCALGLELTAQGMRRRIIWVVAAGGVVMFLAMAIFFVMIST